MSFWLMEHSFGLSRFQQQDGLLQKQQQNRLSHVRCSYILCGFLCRVLFSWPYDFLFASKYTHYILTFFPCAISFSFCVCFLCVRTDIGSWLQLFGFQLHNVVPGFPKPEVGRMEQTYELMKTQTKTQNWDSSKVRFNTRQTLVSCSTEALSVSNHVC